MTAGADAHQGLLVSGRFRELEDALCERVRELKRGRPLAPLTIVVGSAAVRTRIGDLLVRRLGAVANVDVVTLERLSCDLMAVRHGAPPPVLTGLARERLVRRLVDRHTGELAYFGLVASRPHFAAALTATIADLREACVAPGSAWAEAVAAAGPSGGSARARAADLDLLYREYCASLEDLGLLDGAGVHAAAADAVQSTPVPGAVIVYGIHDLNVAQERLVAALLANGADAFVPSPRGAAGDTTTVLVGQRSGLAVRRLAPPEEAADHERLAAVWGAAATAPETSLELAGDGTLAVVSVSDERAELRAAVRTVLAAIDAGASAWDCAVIVPRGDDVALAGVALRDAGLPVACRLPDRSAGARLLTGLADCLVPPAGEPFARRSVVNLLSAAPLRDAGGQAETALWLDEARQAGVVAGEAQWTDRLGRRRRGLERRLADLEARGSLPDGDVEDEGVEKVSAVRLRLAAARGLEAAVGTLMRACACLPARAPWGAWAGALAGVLGAVFEVAPATEAREAASRLEALALLEEEVDLAEVAAALRQLLAGARLPQGRPGRDGVAVLTPLETRGLCFHTVVFTGLAEGGFPAAGRPDPLLGDAERRRVTYAVGARLPLSEQREAESLLLFAFACEAARERLLLLAPRSSAADGRPRLPSRLLLRLASLAAGRPVGLDEYLEGGPLKPVWRRVAGAPAFTAGQTWIDERERDTAKLLSLSARGLRSAVHGYVADVLGGAEAASRRFGAWSASRVPRPGAWDGLLDVGARAALADRHPFDAEMHPTRLERYIACPFAFLLRDVLLLKAPDEPADSLEMDAREFGTLAHAILQRAYERVMAEGLDLDGALRAVVTAWTECCTEAEQRGVTGAAISWEVRRDTLLEDLFESVRRDPVFSPAGGRPVGVEWRFGEAVDRPARLELPTGRSVRFAGRLDRIDTTPAGARIIDYKSGGGGTERNRIKERLSVQLPVYRLAYRQAGGEEHETITCLYRLITRRGGFEDLDLPQDEAASERRLRALVADAVALVDAGMFPRTTRQRCEYCEVGYACGVSAWARARKREHATLQPVVRMQSPASEDEADEV